jgi:hypothetical protein
MVGTSVHCPLECLRDGVKKNASDGVKTNIEETAVSITETTPAASRKEVRDDD